MPGPMSMSQETPWSTLMAQQAQSMGSSPGFSSSPMEQMASQSQDDIPQLTQDEIDEGVHTGQLDPKQPVTLIAKNKGAHKKMSMENPAEENMTPAMLTQQMVDQAKGNADESYNQQQQGIKQLENQIQEYGQQKKGGIDYTPFVGMSKFLSPDNDVSALEKSAQSLKPMSEQEKADKMLNLQNLLQQRKEGMSKVSDAQLAALLKSQTQTSDLATQLKQSTIDKNNAMAEMAGARPEQFDRGIAERAHQNILTKLATNKGAQTKLQAIQGIDNAGSIIEDAPTVTPQIFHDYQQALVGAIQRGNSGISERAERYMKSAGIDSSTIQQYLTGQPVSIPQGKENALYQATKGFAQSERGNIQKQYGQILDSISGGQAHIYDSHPELKKDLNNALDNYKNMAAPKASGGPAVDADLTKLSPEELQHYVDTHGG